MWVGKRRKNSGARALWCGWSPALAAGAAVLWSGRCPAPEASSVQRGRCPGLAASVPAVRRGRARADLEKNQEVSWVYDCGANFREIFFSSLPIHPDFPIGPQ